MIKPPSKPTSAAKGSGPDTDPEKKTGGSAAKRANTSDTKAAYAKASDAKDAKDNPTKTSNPAWLSWNRRLSPLVIAAKRQDPGFFARRPAP